VLARNAFLRGAFRSAAASHLADAYETVPALDRAQMFSAPRIQPPGGRPSIARNLTDKVSILGPTPNGLRLLSDVTTSEDQSYRPAAINRLVAILIRAARDLGEEHVFENSGENLWSLLAERIRQLLASLFTEGALRGASPADAYDVVCDRTTMTQNDIDNGRVIVRVRFQPSFPIDSITVLLALNEGGQATLVDVAQPEAA
jgi:phage tail sheath protein FI